ncbi:MAG: 4-hydroxybenzoate 3-monooxygenase [Gammaproteobacteria bacterium]|nr:4-hydroxybenzoate 3-monooxygenase [Gammaproteobacteria bacterium]
MRTQVVIIGGGPSGLLLSQLLHLAGIESVVLERQSREHVLSRIRAGVLEQGMADLLRQAQAGDRMDREGFIHDGTQLELSGVGCRIDFRKLTGRAVIVYGQTELTRDLYDARDRLGGRVLHDVQDVTLHGLDGDAPYVSYRVGDTRQRLACDFVAGCDGFHGVSRQSIPHALRREYHRVYPFAWLGVLSQTPPVSAELIYVAHDRGFALCSMRNAKLSRYYVQCDPADAVEQWPDERFWEELKRRIPEAAADRIVTGPALEKSITQCRSFVAEPMQWGRLFLAGDAAHIVPPTGAKGLNLAASDIHYLATGLRQYYQDRDFSGLERYSERALARVWQAERFSWWMSTLLHRFPEHDAFDRRMQRAEQEQLIRSDTAQRLLAENYVGLRY